MQKMLANRQVTKRTIADNIKYRKSLLEIDQLSERIKQKNVDMQAIPGYDSFETDQVENEKLWRDLKTERDSLSGQIRVYQEQIKNNEKELTRELYRNIDDDYRKMMIKVKTTEMADADLSKYYNALDKALMKYHSVKMEEINKIIRELWQNTYRGNDIDAIEIRADTEKEKARSYNYKVVMIKGGVEIDMRGRCSAGQKVIACLIIRLALAETFCLNCGILCLDEPTTNLDRENIAGFANSLINIIAARRQQNTFQLVVITHDEEFVQQLGKSEYADYYWRVAKDETQHSTIDRQNIADL